MTCPSKFRPPNVLGYRSGDLDHEETQRRANYQSSTGDGRRHHGPGCVQETPGHRTDFQSLAGAYLVTINQTQQELLNLPIEHCS